MALDLPTCAACGHATFPPHLMCARCGSSEWTTTPAETGTIRRLTFVRRSLVKSATGEVPAIALIETEVGPLVLARVHGDAEPGQTVSLSFDDGAVIATSA